MASAGEVTVKVAPQVDVTAIRRAVEKAVLGYSVADVLLGYSEWLDGQGLFASDLLVDNRSHEELVNDYLEEREEA